MNIRKTLILVFAILFSSIVFGQVKDSSLNIWQCEINYSFQVPGGDMADRFGVNSTIGVGLNYKFKSNWTVGFEVSYLFGGILKDSSSVLEGLMTNNGKIINEHGEYGTVLLTERGFYSGIKLGRVFPVGKSNPNSGIVFNIGAGLLQHHIHIENKDNNTPPVLDDYKKGYDRLTNGLSMREFVGYQYLSNKNALNFYVGLEFYQAWTKCRRDFNFDTMERDDTPRNDYLFGIRAGWILPLYKKSPNKFYYY
ncbi:MAG: hypothetical protein PHZ24_10240 [Bacteroidales bacterium]|nr:hypothetical protein [Bacteroidales bacterium]MDY0140930.1 hypothetical protein [Bacteroidales bacterium]